MYTSPRNQITDLKQLSSLFFFLPFLFGTAKEAECSCRAALSEVVWLCLCADGGADSAEAEEEEVRDYRVKCLNNLAAAQLKLEQYAEALQTSRDVLTLEPNNVKALFRGGKVRALFLWVY